jgi:hypothetical protein
VLTRKEILEHTLGNGHQAEPNVVDQHVRNLRAQLHTDGRSCTLMVGSRDSSPHGDWTRLSVSAFGPNRLMRPWLGMETVRLAVPRAALSPEADAIWPLARLAPFSADTTPSDPARSC